jgi:hypothetical protein
MVSFGFHTASTEADARALLRHSEARNHLSFVLGPEGKLRYGASGDARALVTAAVEVGSPVKTGWPALAVTVDDFFAKAAMQRTVTPAAPPEKEERRLSAVRVRVEPVQALGAGLAPVDGGAHAALRNRPRRRRLPRPRDRAAFQGHAPEVQLR